MDDYRQDSDCLKKRAYDKKTAQTLRNKKEREGWKLRIYPCPYFNHWHLTKKVEASTFKKSLRKKYV